MCDHKKFSQFYGQGAQSANCHAGSPIGKEYVCPEPRIGGTSKGASPYASCLGAGGNMGVLSYCNLGEMPNGNASAQTAKAMYNATGDLVEGSQWGGDGALPPQAHGPLIPASSDAEAESRPEDFNLPACQASHANVCNMPSCGFYFDVSAPSIGNRPSHGVHCNTKATDPVNQNKHLSGRDFGCQQPLWCPKCI